VWTNITIKCTTICLLGKRSSSDKKRKINVPVDNRDRIKRRRTSSRNSRTRVGTQLPSATKITTTTTEACRTVNRKRDRMRLADDRIPETTKTTEICDIKRKAHTRGLHLLIMAQSRCATAKLTHLHLWGRMDMKLQYVNSPSKYHNIANVTTSPRHIHHHRQSMAMDTTTVVTADDPRLPECGPILGHHLATRDSEVNHDADDARDRVPDLRQKTAHDISASQPHSSVDLSADLQETERAKAKSTTRLQPLQVQCWVGLRAAKLPRRWVARRKSAKRRGKSRNRHGKRKTAMGAVAMIGGGNQRNPEVGVIAAAAIGRGAGADKEGTCVSNTLVWVGPARRILRYGLT
jgi:hypothetical protein